MRAEDLLAELERDIAWREEELNSLYRDLSESDSVIERAKRRSIVPMVQAHAEGFVRFALQSYLRFITSQNASAGDVKEVHLAWMLAPEFNRIRMVSVDADYSRLGMGDDNRRARVHYSETRFLETLTHLLTANVFLDDSPLDQFDQNLTKPYLLSLLYHCGLEVQPHSSYSGRLNGLVLRRNNIAHGEDAGAQFDEIARWYDTVRRLFTTIRDEVYRSASEKLYLRCS